MDSALSCRDLRLRHVPTDCFLDYPSALTVDLSGNDIESLGEDDFTGLTSVETLSLSQNKIASLHSRTFQNLSALRELRLEDNVLEVLPEGMLAYQPSIREFSIDNNNLIKLPLSLFSDDLQETVTFNVTNNYLRAVPCSTVSSLPLNSSVAGDAVQVWAQHEEEIASCSFLNLPFVVSMCMPVDTRSNNIDCTALHEPFSPLKATLAESESRGFYNATDHIVFIADVEDLMGEPPSPISCLPDDLDVAGSFLVFHRYTPDLHLEGLSFDLADLPSHTSELTNSVTILADTVILTRPIPPLRYRLTVSARKIVLAHPILIEASTALYPPTNAETFYQLRMSAGRVNGVTVVQYEHGLLTLRLLDGADVMAQHTCQPLPVYSEDTVREWVSARQLWLTIYCSSTLRESDEKETLLYAKELASFVTRMTTNWTKVDMVGTNQRATNLLYDINAALSNSLLPRNVPYLSVSVYAEMVPFLADNIAVYKESYDGLRKKLMMNAERLFDMNIHFEERKADLEFMQSNAQRAVEMAGEVHSVHSAQLQNHVSWAISSWEAIMDIYEKVLASRPQVDAAVERAERGLKAYKRQQRFVSFLNIGTTFARCLITGGASAAYGVVSNVGEVVSNAFEFKSFGETMDEITEKIEAVNVMMVKTQDFMSTVPPLPPPDGDQLGWIMTFNNSEALFAIAREAAVTADQWKSAGLYSIKCLADEDFTDKVDGVKNLKMKLNELRVWSQALAEQVQAFCEYVATMLEEVSNLAEDAAAVDESNASLDSVNDMLVDEAVTEENYKEHIVEQNLAVLDVMMKLFLKSRSDVLAINLILHEYCSAYFYAFFKECDPANSPSLWDNYDAILYKLNKIQFESLNSISSLSPPPQPFQKTIRVVDTDVGCEDGAATSEGAVCPVSALAFSGSTSFNLADHWGPGLSFGARIRMDRLRIYLQGLEEHTVSVNIILDLL